MMVANNNNDAITCKTAITRWLPLIACLHDQNKSGFFGGPAFIQPVRTIWKVFKKLWLAGKKPALQKCHFCLIM